MGLYYESITKEEEQEYIDMITKAAPQVFSLCKDIPHPGEENEVSRQRVYLYLGRRNEFGKYVNDEVLTLGELSEEQVMKRKDVTYFETGLRKAYDCAKWGNSGDPRDRGLFLGAVNVPGTDIVVSCSGFLQEKDELYVLTLLVEAKVITLDQAVAIANKHNNWLFLDHFWELFDL